MQVKPGRPRIALIAASLDILGGQAVQASLLATLLRRDGYRVTFIPINPAFPKGLRWLRRYPYVRTLVNQLLYVPSLLRLHTADVVHVFSASYGSFLLAPLPALLMARAFGKRVVLHYHSGEAADHLARWGCLLHPWLRLADVLVVPSDYLKRTFASHGYRVRVIRNVVDLSAFRYRVRAPLRPRFLSTRNLEPYYRVDNTLLAFALLRSRYPEASLTIVGDGSQAGELWRLAASLGDKGIRFLGPVQQEHMPAIYDDADIFLNSSVVDNQPVSVLEAFASGLPVVSTGTGDLAQMVREGETGLLVPANDPAAMAKAMEFLLQTPDIARRMVAKAREEVTQYTWTTIRHQWEAVYG